MIRTAPPAAAGTARTRICTACPLLCDDLVDGPRGVEHACEAGAAAFAAARTLATAGGEAWLNAAPAASDQAIDAAAAAIVGGSRVLFTGLGDATLEAILAACDLAETIGAAVDSGGSEAARVTGPTIARVGEVTAEWEELRDRADLVLFWFCDPARSHPRFLERFVQPSPAVAKDRQTIAVGPDAVLPPGPRHRHLPLPAEAEVDAARILQARMAARSTTATAIDAACGSVAEAIAAAECVGFVTRHDDDLLGLRSWSAASVLRGIAHARPAFQIPLGGGVRGGANEKGVAAVSGWRYAATAAIPRADRGGAEFRPAECDARRMIERGDVDCVVVVGRASAAVDAAVAAQGDRLLIVRITEAAEPVAGAAIQIRTASQFMHRHGSMLRGDGRLIRLGDTAPTERPSTEVVVRAIEERVRLRLSAAAGGTR